MDRHTTDASEGMTFESAPPDLKFSDLGPPPERVATEDGNARRRVADAEATWTAKCLICGANISGTRDHLVAHGTTCATDFLVVKI